MVLPVVLLVIVAGALAATGALMYATAQRAGAAAATRRVQARAAAWSGVQAVMAELEGQRDRMLRGARPRVERSRELATARQGATGGLDRCEFRLVGEEGNELVAEAGRLDVNVLPTDVLARGGLSAGLAAEIAEARKARRFASEREVTGLPGWGSGTAADEGAGPKGAAKSDGTGDLLNRVTVFAFEEDTRGDGEPRIDLGAGWSEEIAAALREVLGADLTEAVRVAAVAPGAGAPAAETQKRAGPASRGELCARLLQAGISGRDLAKVLDAATVGSEPVRTGRVSVMEASAAALGAIPGIGPDVAEKIVRMREQVSEEERAGLGWLIDRQLLTPAQFAGAVDLLTTRSMVWRVVVEGGVVPGIASTVAEDAPLRDRVVLEAVIDLSAERARVAYVRDVTMLPAAGWLDAWAAREPRRESAGEDPAREARSGESVPTVGVDSGPALPAPPEATDPEPARVARPGGGSGRVGRWTTGGQR